MQKTDMAYDYSGRALAKGDTVSTLSGDMTGRISDLASEDDTCFVRLRPVHQPYGRGTWYAADRLVYLASSQRRRR